MAILLPATSTLLPHNKLNHVLIRPIALNTPVRKNIIQKAIGNSNTRMQRVLTKAKTSLEAEVQAKDSATAEPVNDENDFGVVNLHHVGILCENLERSLDFYQNLLGLKINEARPHV